MTQRKSHGQPERPARLPITPVPAGYRPGYPAELSAAEFREWIARRNDQRLAGMVLAGSLLLGGTCDAEVVGAAAPGPVAVEPEQQDPAVPKPDPAATPEQGADRQERIRRLLGELGRDRPGWFEHASFPAPATPTEPLVPRVPISFGNSYMGVFDVGRARKLALQAFRAYGLDVRPDAVVAEGGDEARLDGWVGARRVGFLLRKDKGDRSPAALTAEELRAFREAGYRLHVADAGSYAIYDGDGFTASIAYLAGIVDFLNAVTDGPDVELASLLRGATRKLTLDDLEVESPPGVEVVKSSPEYGVWTVDRKATISIRQTSTLEGQRGSGFSMLMIRLYPMARDGKWDLKPWTRVRLRQPATGVELESRAVNLFPPPAFDALRPFTVEVEVEPGEYYLQGLLIRTRS